MKANCDICGTEIEVQMCCSGRECGCRGMPIDPPVCSDECYDKYMDKIGKFNKNNLVPLKPTDLDMSEHQS